MAVLGVIAGFLYIGMLGFWLMGKLDRFIHKGGIAPYWDVEEARISAGCGKKDSSKVS